MLVRYAAYLTEYPSRPWLFLRDGWLLSGRKSPPKQLGSTKQSFPVLACSPPTQLSTATTAAIPKYTSSLLLRIFSHFISGLIQKFTCSYSGLHVLTVDRGLNCDLVSRVYDGCCVISLTKDVYHVACSARTGVLSSNDNCELALSQSAVLHCPSVTVWQQQFSSLPRRNQP